MSTLAQLGEGLERAWGLIADGWRQLRQRAAHSLTQFHPLSGPTNVDTADDRFLARASRWGLLTADVSETETEVVVRLEVPGLETEDLDVHVVNNHLVVRGEKRLQKSQVEGRWHVIECAYGAFERAVPLPAEVEEQGARARYRRGVLMIHLPKKRIARCRRIEVRT